MQIGTPIGESASLLPPHVCSIDGTGKTILLLCTKIELHIFLPSPLGNAGVCFCFEQPPRLAYEGLRDAGPLISIVSLTHFCCSQKAAPGVAGPRLQPCGLQTPAPCPGSPQDTGRSPPGSARPLSAGRRLLPQDRGLPGDSPATEPSPVRGVP